VSLTRREFLGGALAAGVAACGRGGVDPDALARRTYDLCVIGSGFAGMPLALHASAQGLDTLVVEAGARLAADFSCASSGLDYPVQTSRLIALGGASNHWEGTVSRLRPSDLKPRSRFGQDVDWPLDYAELEPYYCRAEQALAVEGYPPVEGAEPPRACAYPQEPSAPYRPPQLEVDGRRVRYFPLPRSHRDGGPVRLAEVEVPAFAGSPHGALLDGHRATRLVSLDGARIDHVELRGEDGAVRRAHARIFVVAAGVVESARLLLLSDLGNGADLVGRERGLNACHFQLRAWEDSVVLKLQPELEPRPENRVTLSADAQPQLRFDLSPRDLATLAAGEECIARQVRALGGRFERAEPSLKWRWHPSGTARMGFGAKDGVVDRDLRVFGTENLYVCGAAVFPTGATANPTLTVVALSLRLADHLT
jgi:choline dehydrogenase-like flavoprotein